jgi:CopG family nickel-responsive transcriptional regulator
MHYAQRFGVSIDQALLSRFDQEITAKGYVNRSEALRDLIRQYLVKTDIEKNVEVVGTLTLVYNHHVPDLSKKLNDLQHDYYRNILTNVHIHLDHHHCLEVIILKGCSQEIARLADLIIGVRGVKHGQLTFTSTGKALPGV